MKKLLLIALLAMISSLSATQVLVFAGSTRTGSYNKLLAQEAAEVARQEGAKVVYIDLKDLPIPFYDADLEIAEGLPANVKKLRDLMISSDAIIIASPQYNASISPVLKNALDWASRGEDGKGSCEAYRGKKFAIMSASPGKRGGAKGLVHLRQVIEDCKGEVMDSQLSFGLVDQAFDEQGHFKDPKSAQMLKRTVQVLIQSASSPR